MNSVGPTWAFILTVDAAVFVAIVLANLSFALSVSVLVFRKRPPVDRILIAAGVFAVVCAASLAGLHLFAATPIHEAQVLILD